MSTGQAMLAHIGLMARYNAWMNAKLYDAAGSLPAAEFTRPCGAFFGSLCGTLNHIVVADTLWLQRFAAHPARFAALEPVRVLPAPGALDTILFAELGALRAHRERIDAVIVSWAAELCPDDLALSLDYRNTKGVAARRNLGSLLMHFFNHQTHHRGQACTLLSQGGIDVGVTDLLALIPEENAQ